jgi:hypothetical protein
MSDEKPHETPELDQDKFRAWVREICRRLERELIRKAQFKSVHGDDLEELFAVAAFDVFESANFRNVQTDMRRESVLHECEKARLALARLTPFNRWVLLVSDGSSALIPGDDSTMISEDAHTIADIARRDGRAISYDPSKDHRLSRSQDCGSMVAVRLDDPEMANDRSGNVFLGIADSTLTTMSPEEESRIFAILASACADLQLTLHKTEMVWDLATLLLPQNTSHVSFVVSGRIEAGSANESESIDGDRRHRLRALFARRKQLLQSPTLDNSGVAEPNAKAARTARIEWLYKEIARISEEEKMEPNPTHSGLFDSRIKELRKLQHEEADEIERFIMASMEYQPTDGDPTAKNAIALLNKYANPASPDSTSE